MKCGCLVGFGLCLALMCIIFGIDALTRYKSEEELYDEVTSYSTQSHCLVTTLSRLRSASRRGRQCRYARFGLQLFVKEDLAGGRETTDIEPETQDALDDLNVTGVVLLKDDKFSFSNFFDERCGGFLPMTSIQGAVIRCWYRTIDNAKVRVSAADPVDNAVLIYGVVLVCVGGIPLIAFIVYNCFLCCHARNEREDDRDRRPTTSTARSGSTEPATVNPEDIPEAKDGNWLVDNSYARAVLNALRRRRVSDSAANDSCEMDIAPPEAAVVDATPQPEAQDCGETAVDIPRDCPVCYEAFDGDVVLLECGHMLCVACTTRLLDGRGPPNLKCPTCRAQIPLAQMKRVPYCVSPAA